MEPEAIAPGPADVLAVFQRRYQHLLDRTVVHLIPRWVTFAVLLLAYFARVYALNGWFIVTYGLGIYLLNLFIGFITPAMDPVTAAPLLPTRNADTGEFRPFSRKLPEFKFWHGATVAVLVAFVMTFFSFFNIPVFWPILLIYFIVLFTITMRNQIAHMLKHGYVPITFGKATYGGGKGKGGAALGGGGGQPALGAAEAAAKAGAEPRFTGSNLR